MDSFTLAAVAADLTDRMVGRRLGSVVVTTRDQLAIGTADGALLVSIAPTAPRVHLLPSLPVGPRPEPSIQIHFDSLLRGTEVIRSATVDFDRVLHLEVEGLDRVGNARAFTLIVELMGKHSAAVVVDQAGLIVATLKTVTSAVNRHRQLLPKVPYVAPPTGHRRDPFALSLPEWQALWPTLTAGQDLRSGWRAALFGLSDQLWTWLVARDAVAAPEAVHEALEVLAATLAQRAWAPCLVKDENGRPTHVWPLRLPGADPLPDLHAGLAALAERNQEQDGWVRRRSELVGAIRRARSKLDSRRQGLERALHRSVNADSWQHQAELLLANLGLVQPGASRVTVDDWVTELPVEIEVDPRLSATANAQALFDRAKKARRSAEGVPEQMVALERDSARLQQIATELATAKGEDDVDRIAASAPEVLATVAPAPVSEKPRTERERWLRRLERRTSSDGFTILIGRNAQDSEGLLSRVAAPTDLWFHVRGAGSGHVIVRTNGQPDRVPQQTIMEAAQWAARCSKMKHSSLVPVVYTQRKYVTKVTGGAAGKVVYRHEKSLFVAP